MSDGLRLPGVISLRKLREWIEGWFVLGLGECREEGCGFDCFKSLVELDDCSRVSVMFFQKDGKSS